MLIRHQSIYPRMSFLTACALVMGVLLMTPRAAQAADAAKKPVSSRRQPPCVVDTGSATGPYMVRTRPPYIVVDTGHTPKHPGAIGASGRVEYAYNLDLSGAVAARLAADGDRVLRTSADGREIGLEDRSTQAPDADLFISIHHDSVQQRFIDAGRQREFSGYAVFVSERNPRYEQSRRCACAIATRLRAAGEHPSLYHAQPIEGENRPLIDAKLGIHRFDDLAVLRTAPIPAVLVEAGVIVNPDEEVRLARHDTIDHLSAAIASGIQTCTAP